MDTTLDFVQDMINGNHADETGHVSTSDTKHTETLEREFIRDYDERSLIPQRRSAFGILMISLCFGTLDLLLPLRPREITFAVHYLVLCPMLAMVCWSTYQPWFKRWSQEIMLGAALIYAGTYLSFEYVAPTVPGSEASRTTVILILVLMVAATLLRLRTRYASVCCYGCALAYAFSAFTVFRLPSPAYNVGAVLVTALLGNLLAFINEQNAKTEYVLRRNLAKDQRYLSEQNAYLDTQNSQLIALATLRLDAARDVEHQINNKLISVGMLVEAAIDLGNLDKNALLPQPFLDHALNDIRDLHGELQIMLNVSRLAAGFEPMLDEPEPVCLAEIIHTVCGTKHAQLKLLRSVSRHFNEDESPEIVIHISEPGYSGEPIMLHRYAVKLILENLLDNAVKYSPHGGTISVNVSDTADEVVLQVCDQGIGISSERLPTLFDTVYERGHVSPNGISGTGVGLHIIHKLMTSQSGRIWAESDGVGHGATFSIAFPKCARTSAHD